MKENYFPPVFGIIGGVVTTWLGGYDPALKCLLIMMLCDIIMGLVSAAFFNKSQYSKNGLKSEAMIQGIFRKMAMLIVIVLGVCIDKILDMCYIRNALVLYFIASEGLSLLEHMVNVGVPFPKFLSEILQKVLEQEDNINMNGGEPND